MINKAYLKFGEIRCYAGTYHAVKLESIKNMTVGWNLCLKRSV
jgi:hypothetical protein